MKIEAIKQVKGTAVPVPGDDIDTDRIIPARYLKCITFDGLGLALFFDERFGEGGKSLGHPVDAPEHKGARFIISGNNFGCGSSREHAPQAIIRAGYDVIIAGSYAEIFFGNSTTLGIVCVTMSDSERAELFELVKKDPKAEFELDVEARTLTAGGKTYNVGIKDGARKAFLDCTYDSLAQLLAGKEQVKALEATLPYRF
jgi:3-isopropylmalate/(R)-2-methylmalate dehydratase small subunit